MVVTHTFNPRTLEARQVDLCEFKANLVYRVSSRTVRAVRQRKPVSKNKTRKKFSNWA